MDDRHTEGTLTTSVDLEAGQYEGSREVPRITSEAEGEDVTDSVDMVSIDSQSKVGEYCFLPNKVQH